MKTLFSASLIEWRGSKPRLCSLQQGPCILEEDPREGWFWWVGLAGSMDMHPCWESTQTLGFRSIGCSGCWSNPTTQACHCRSPSVPWRTSSLQGWCPLCALGIDLGQQTPGWGEVPLSGFGHALLWPCHPLGDRAPCSIATMCVFRRWHWLS
jgi:hypothetical protein